jgi:polyhydroxyalkanoate synthesis regulator phasin
MLSAVVIAFIAIAIAIGLAVAGLRQIAAVRHRLDGLRAELDEAVERGARRAGEVARSTVDDAVTQLKISREDYDKAIGSQRRRTDLLYLSADAGVSKADRMVTDLERYAVRTLEHQVTSDPAPMILRAGLYSRQPAVLDVVPDLIDSLLASLEADMMYRQDDGNDGWKFYLRWPAGSDEPATLLGSLLTQARAGDGAAGPDSGVVELRALLSVLIHGGRAVLILGPLVVVATTRDDTSAGFAPDGWQGLTVAQKQTAVTGDGPGILTEIGATDIVDLSG